MRVATFNVKDLFPARRPEHAAVLPRKVARLGEEIARVAPAVIGLQEIGDEALLAEVAQGAGGYQVFAGPRDERGIGNAVLVAPGVAVTSHRVHAIDALPFPVFAAGDPPPFTFPLRRPFVEVVVDGPTGPLAFVTLHLKSNLPLRLRQPGVGEAPFATSRERAEGAVRALVVRTAEALFARRIADEHLAAGRAVVVAGDMNDGDASVPVRTLKGDGDDRLVSVLDHLPEHRRYTVYHRGAPLLIDHLLLSAPLAARIVAADVANDRLRDHGAFVKEAPPSEDSDHALLWAELR